MRDNKLFIHYGETYYSLLIENGFTNLKVNYDSIKEVDKFLNFIKDRDVNIYLVSSSLDDAYLNFIDKLESKCVLFKNPTSELLGRPNEVISYNKNLINARHFEIDPTLFSKNELDHIIKMDNGIGLHLTTYRKKMVRYFDSITITDWINVFKYKTIFVLKNGEVLHYKTNEVDVLRGGEVAYICEKYNIDTNGLVDLNKDVMLKYTLSVFKELADQLEKNNQKKNEVALAVGDKNITASITNTMMQTCDTCGFTMNCPYLNSRDDHKCVFTSSIREIKDAETFQEAIFSILNIQLQRIQRGLISESLNGTLSDNLSKEMELFMKITDRVHKMSKKDESIVIFKGKVAEEPSLLRNFFDNFK